MDWILGLFGTTNTSAFKSPDYIKEATKKKYGQDIFVIGVSSQQLSEFHKGMSYHTLETTRPVEVGRSVVDVDCKSHTNTAKGEEEHSDKKPEDWYDEFEITSKKDRSKAKSKSYQLKLESSKTKSFGGNLGLKIAGAGFFNMAAAPEASAGASASYSKTTTKSDTEESKLEESLSHGYEVVDSLKVPPKTKVVAMITTWAVTYESTTTTEVTVDTTHVLPVRYRTMLSRRLGGIFTSTGVLTAQDLFEEEEGFKCEEYVATFQQHGKISYLGEEVEVVKQKIPI